MRASRLAGVSLVVAAWAATAAPHGELRSVPEHFRDYDQMLAHLVALAAAHPEIARLVDVGDSWGRLYGGPDYPQHEIWALKISDHPEIDEAEPVIAYIGAQHAREPAGVEIALAIADTLLAGHGLDPDVTRWVESHETWILPLVNPDGAWCCRQPGWAAWRKNLRDNDGSGGITAPYGIENEFYWPDGVDLNRNHGWQWGGLGGSSDPRNELYRGPAAFSEPETQALREFQLEHLPAMLVDYHSHGELVLWPYGYDDSTSAPDELLLAEIGTQLAERIERLGGGTYLPRPAHQLYPAAGALTDWAYGAIHTFAFTIETGTQLYPPAEELERVIAANVCGALYLQARLEGPGVRGILTAGGAPVAGTIRVEGIDDPALGQPRGSRPLHGDYCRLLLPGVYDLSFEAPGWEAVRVEGLVVPATGLVTLEVDLQVPAACPPAWAGAAALRAWPVPARMGEPVHLEVGSGTEGATVEIFDLLGRRVARLDPAPGGHGVWRPLATRTGAGVYLARSAAAPGAVRRLILLGP